MRDARDQRPPSARLPRRSRGDDRLGACRRAASPGARRTSSAGPSHGRGRGRARRRRTPDPRASSPNGQDGIYQGEAVLDDDGRGNSDIHIRATVTKTRQRPVDRPFRLAREVTGFINSSYPNMHSAVGVALSLPDGPAHAEERRHVPPGEGHRQGGHGGLGQARRAGDARAPTIAARKSSRRSSRRWRPPAPTGRWPAGAAVSASRSRARTRAETDPSSGISSRRGRAAALRRPATAGPAAANGRRRAGSSSAASRSPRCASRCSSRATSSAPIPAATGRFAAARAVIVEMVVETDEPPRQHRRRRRRHGACGMLGGEDGAPHRYDPALGQRRPIGGRLKTKEVGLTVVAAGRAVFEDAKSGGGGWLRHDEAKPSSFRLPRACPGGPRIASGGRVAGPSLAKAIVTAASRCTGSA